MPCSIVMIRMINKTTTGRNIIRLTLVKLSPTVISFFLVKMCTILTHFATFDFRFKCKKCHLTRKVTLYARAFVLIVFYICIFVAHFFLVLFRLTALHATRGQCSYRVQKMLASTLSLFFRKYDISYNGRILQSVR